MSRGPNPAAWDRKRVEGKPHTQAVLALTRSRTDVRYAMMRTTWRQGF